jgi:RNA polymerase sigma-70 factor (ECF subfamily)
MAQPESTCWTVIQGAAAGGAAERDLFARRYAPVVRAYLAARWRTSPHQKELDDTVQEVFVECFRAGGVLDRVEPGRPGGFRPFLYGVVRNVALRIETARAREHGRQAPSGLDLENLAGSEESLSRAFDRAWAKSLLREAAVRQEERARHMGEAALKRVELLRLRFHEGLPIREIARRWQADPAVLHHEYARARQEFKAALLEVVTFHHPGTAAEIEQECANLLSLL